MNSSKEITLNTLTIALGANIPSYQGPPCSTLIAVRPLLEKEICEWVKSSLKENVTIDEISFQLKWQWSPLFESEALGGPPNQPNFINAVVIIYGPLTESMNPSESAALDLLTRTRKLEKLFGRERNKDSIRWGPRSLDIDLLAWGNLQIRNQYLTLPHPRILERNFVLMPLATALNLKTGNSPLQLSPQKNWAE
tara:strand:+ start:1146 stop:1730 length:585 start_codon:yes stop_codon:yes gene_type:complete